MTLTVSLNSTQLYFQLYFAKVADMSGWLSRTVYKICHNKDWKLLAADLKTKMDIWEFAGEWRRENKTHVHVTHNKHTLIWSHTDTHSSLQPQNHLSTFKCFGPAHTETSQQLPLVRSQQSPAVTGFLTCSGERRVDRVSQLLKLCWNSCCCCRVEAHYLLWLMSPETLPGCQVGHAPPTLLHSRPVGETTQKVLHDSPWRRLRMSGRSQDLDFKHDTEETIDAVTSPISRSNTSNPIFLRISYLYFYWKYSILML